MVGLVGLTDGFVVCERSERRSDERSEGSAIPVSPSNAPRKGIALICYDYCMMQIRKAGAKDVDAIYDLGRAVPQFAVNEETITFWPKDILGQAVASDDTIVLVAEADQHIVGFIIANLNVSLRKAIIENVYVRPENRDAGTGSKLLDELLTSLGGTGIEYVSTLIPLDADSATHLYVEAGFSKGESFLWLDKPLTATFRQ